MSLLPPEARAIMRASDTFVAYADGSSLGNPGVGAWAYLLMSEVGLELDCLAAENVTNNVMELSAAIRVMQKLPAGAVGAVRCDAEYVVKGVNVWRKGWIAKGWRKADNKPVANKDLWLVLSNLVDAAPGVRFEWVKAHASDPFNLEVDELARTTAEAKREEIRKTF